MDIFTAPVYWTDLLAHCPELAKIETAYIANAVHTAALSMGYNRGAVTTANLFKSFLAVKDYGGLAFAIRGVKSSCKSLADRRGREADLIITALHEKETFVQPFFEITAKPLTTIPFEHKELLMDAEGKA